MHCALLAVAFASAMAQVTPITIGGVYLEYATTRGTVTHIKDAGDTSTFSFTPNITGGARYHHFGDITIRYRAGGSGGAYTLVSTATSTTTAPTATGVLPGSFAAWDISTLLNINGLRVIREFTSAPDGLGVLLHYTLTNTGANAIELGAFGMSVITNNNWNGLTLAQNAARCSLLEPAIAHDGGFAKVIRITGSGPVLLVAPHTSMGCDPAVVGNVVSCGAPLEAWRPLHEDPATGIGTVFEGYYQWMVRSAAYAANEWATATPWNTPSSLLLPAGGKAVYSWRLFTAPSQDEVEATLIKAGVPVMRGVPGYTIPADVTTAQMVVAVPAGVSIGSITVAPSATALKIGTPRPLTAPWVSIPVAAGSASTTGRARVTISFARTGFPPVNANAQFFITPSVPALLATYAQFTADHVWYNDTTDAFARAYSFMGYDDSIKRVMVQEEHVYIAGLSDEAGAGAGVAIATHSWKSADPLSATLVATYVNRTLAGRKRDGAGTLSSVQQTNFGMRASMFWGTNTDKMPGYTYTVCQENNPPWYCWDQARSLDLGRSYNYPHGSVVYFSMYRLSRDHDKLPALSATIAASRRDADALSTDWTFYLNRSAQTLIAMGKFGGYSADGMMEGPVYAKLLDALKEEMAINPTDWTPVFNDADAMQRQRTQRFMAQPFPYGSEMPFDTTGQAEIFAFTHHYGADYAPNSYVTSNLTMAATKAYTPGDVPHYAYQGSARRYWDCDYNCKINRWAAERTLHHYGSGINSEVLMDNFRMFPNDTLSLRAGWAATVGQLTNINATTGFPSMGLHGDPSMLVPDSYSADFGVGFYGAAQGFGCIIVDDEVLGEAVGYGCDVTTAAVTGIVTATPRDAYHTQLYVGPLGLNLELRTSAIISAALDTSTAQTLTITLDAVAACVTATSTRIVIGVPTHPSQTKILSWSWVSPAAPPPLVRGAFELPCATPFIVLKYVPK